MLVFGHTGITLGVAALSTVVLFKRRSARANEVKAIEPCLHSSQTATDSDCSRNNKSSWLASFGRYINMRFLLIGSLLPDLIDKPVGQFFFRETFGSGRIFCHTILFFILITMAGLYFYRRHDQTWLLAFSFGTFTHLILDQMWLIPKTLFWPLYGFTFERLNTRNWIPNMLHALLTEPRVYVPELLGLTIIICFAWALLRRRTIYTFIKYGRI